MGLGPVDDPALVRALAAEADIRALVCQDDAARCVAWNESRARLSAVAALLEAA
ncbi:MAG: hypothetical protein IAI50_20445 [Candidatus Eremiobacteraeota bacterium]|nr:hypothetical protein [Candidatus Eremiobacteraeota bacterium]